MQLITKNSVLERNLFRCIGQYEKVAFATAWASADTNVFRLLQSRKNTIQQAVIGTHFYQTHPDVLDEFVGHKEVRFILQSSGVFHPKIFVFWNADGWEGFVGSANLTKGALANNSEAVLLISQDDPGSSALRSDIIKIISEYWRDAECASKASAKSYREIWKLRKPLLDRLSGQYGRNPSKKSPVSSSVMSMSWSSFYNETQKSSEHNFKERCELLDLARVKFQSGVPLNKMESGLRYMIAGLRTDYDPRWGWFGSMIGAGKYYAAVKRNDIHLSRALDLIPLKGVISREQYNEYTTEYVLAFPEGRHGIATATRLLAMKRPDQFVCFDKMNRVGLCYDFGIKVSGMNYERYWDEIVERIMDSAWWNSPAPSRRLELSAWKGRSAMLDAIFYEA
jgi:HKD family nuclease